MDLYLDRRLKTINENNQRRIETLFDAVIAIAMTMMALQIVLPQVQHFDIEVLKTLFSEITVYLISYIVLASILVIHAMLFSSYSSLGGPGYIIINIILMFIVTIFPILTKLMAEYNSNGMLRWIYISTYFFMELIISCILVSIKNKNTAEILESLQIPVKLSWKMLMPTLLISEETMEE